MYMSYFPVNLTSGRQVLLPVQFHLVCSQWLHCLITVILFVYSFGFNTDTQQTTCLSVLKLLLTDLLEDTAVPRNL